MNSAGSYGPFDDPACGGTKTFGPKEFVRKFGDRRLTETMDLRCPQCGDRLQYLGLIDPRSFMDPDEEKFYRERIFNDYLIKLVILVLITLTLFGLSSYLPPQLSFILTSSILTSATLITIFLTVFTFYSKFRLAVIAFERSVKDVTISFLLICLALAVAALFLILLI